MDGQLLQSMMYFFFLKLILFSSNYPRSIRTILSYGRVAQLEPQFEDFHWHFC